MVSVLQDAVSALLARTSAELLAVEQELAQEEEEVLEQVCGARSVLSEGRQKEGRLGELLYLWDSGQRLWR